MPELSRKYKVAWLCLSLTSPGGMPQQLFLWAKYRDKSRFDLSLLYSSTIHKEIENAFRALPEVRLQHYPGLTSMGWRYLSAWHSIAEYLKKERIDILHTYLVQSDWLGVVAGAWARTPVILTSIVGTMVPHSDWRRQTLAKFIYPLVLRRMNAVISTCDYLRDEVVENYGAVPEKIHTVYAGIEFHKFDFAGGVHAGPPHLDFPVIGTACFLHNKKGVAVLIEAAARVMKSFPRLQVLIGGEGPEMENLRALAQRVGIADRVRFAGWISNLPEFYQQLDLFILPSYPGYDSVPHTLKESLACGTPVIATRVAGVPELVRDGETGLLVSPGNSSELAAAIEKLLRNPDWMRKLTEQGRAVVRGKFTIEKEVRSIEALYENCLRDAGRL